jgi:hypothetical protein
MNTMKILGLTATALGVVLATSTEMRGAEVAYLKLTRPMVIAGVDLRAAVYAVQWDLQGTRATVTFSRRGRVVATVQGTCATLDRIVPGPTLYFSRRPEGYFAIAALGFAGSNRGIVFPLLRSRPRNAQGDPVGSAFQEEDWHASQKPHPQIYK